MTDRFSLSESDVRAWTAPRFVERGARYANQGRIHRLRREGKTIKGACEGSQPAPYHVRVVLGDSGIAEAHCSCPMGAGGSCKHVVALLLTYLRADSVRTVDPLEDTLRQQPPDRLVDLILKMVERHPDLERLVETTTSARTEIDAAVLREKVASVFEDALRGSGYGYEYGYAPGRALAADLEPFLDLAADLADQERLADAAAVYRLVAEETCDQYGTFPDESGELSRCVQTCTEHLGDLLARADDEGLRDTILRILFQVYIDDLTLGGHGLGDVVPEVILETATSEEQARVATWVRDRIPGDGAPSDDVQEHRIIWLSGSTSGASSWSRQWKHQALGDFLLQLEAEHIDDEQFLAICRQTGRLRDLVDRLLDLGRLDEALDAVRTASDHEIVQRIPLFREHDALDALRSLLRDRLSDDTASRLVAWMRDDAQKRGDLDYALDLSQRLFWENPSPSAYRTVRALAQDLDRWDERRNAIHSELERRDHHGLLVRLHLVDDDVKAALDRLPRAGGDWRYGGRSLRVDVAQAAEDEHPESAIDIYHTRARSLIEQRGRSNYSDAADLMQRVKVLCKQHDWTDEWQDMIDRLVEDELHRLPAGRDEFQKAGLL